MTTHRSIDLDVPGELPTPLPANVLDFFVPPRLPFVVTPLAILVMAERQRERAIEKAVARHERRAGRRKAIHGDRR